MSPLSKAQIPRLRDGLQMERELSPIPDLHINNLIRLQRLAEGEPQQSIRLTQTEKRVRFLAPYRSKSSPFEFPANVMRSIAFVR